MELKETNSLPTSVGINVAMLSEKNNSGNHGAYEILFPLKEDSPDQNTENNDSDKYFGKPIFRNVSTLDWLKTWRSLEIS